jgi:hypothetical protein
MSVKSRRLTGMRQQSRTRRRCSAAAMANACCRVAGLAIVLVAVGPRGAGSDALDLLPDLRFAQQQASAGVEAGVRTRTGVRTRGITDFPDNTDCKMGGSLPGSRSQPGLEQTCCCQVCPAQFLVELQLFQLSADEEYETFRSFHEWHRARLGLPGPMPLPEAAARMSSRSMAAAAALGSHGGSGDGDGGGGGGGFGALFRGSGGRDALLASETILAFLEAESVAAGGAGEGAVSRRGGRSGFFGGPSKAGDVNMVTEAGPCCPLCPSSFTPRRADAVTLPLVFAEESVRLSGGGTAAAAVLSSESESESESALPGRGLRRRPDVFGAVGWDADADASMSRKKSTRTHAAAAATAAAVAAAFVQTDATGVFEDRAKSMSDRQGEGDPVCCNVCVAQESVPQSYTDVMTHPDQMAKTGACACCWQAAFVVCRASRSKPPPPSSPSSVVVYRRRRRRRCRHCSAC